MSLSRAVVLGVVGGDGSVKISINALSFLHGCHLPATRVSLLGPSGSPAHDG